jgi:hypothetical protein
MSHIRLSDGSCTISVDSMRSESATDDVIETLSSREFCRICDAR